jgi:hypothetical protein
MFFFLSFWFLFIADVLLLFEVVVSQRRIVLFVNLVWELRSGGGGCLDPWKCRSIKKKKKAWMEMRRMFEEEREFGEKMRN